MGVGWEIRQGDEFDGSDDYLDIDDPGTGSVLDFDDEDPITLSAWVYPENLSSYDTFLAKGSTAVSINTNYGLQFDASGTVNFWYYDSSIFQWYQTTGTVSTDEWAHILMTYTFGTGSSIKIYINGVEQSGSWISGNGDTAPVVSNESLWLGANGNASGNPTSEEFDGFLDEVKIYNYAMTVSQVNTEFNQGRSL